MNRIIIAAVVAVAGCSTARPREPLTSQRLEAAKQACGAVDAYVFDAQGQPAVTFSGVATDFNARQTQAQCLKEQLKGTDVRFVGFLSEPPPPQ